MASETKGTASQEASAAPDASAAAAAPTAEQLRPPPAEKPHETRRRSSIILSFWLIVLLLGIPFWWHTTSIYRADLPHDEMLRWADGKACRPVFPLQISIRADDLPQRDALNLLRQTQHALDDLNDFSGHHLRLRSANSVSDGAAAADTTDNDALTIQLRPGEALSATLDPHTAALSITYPPSSTASPHHIATYIANELRAVFAEEQSIISYLLSSSSSSPSSSSSSSSPGLSQASIASHEKRVTRSFRYAPTYHLSFSLFTDGATPNTWDVEAAVEAYIQPILDVLGPIHNFTIDTQVQLYATPGVESQVLDKGGLASFINAAEWPLSPSIGGAPTINFLLFVGNQTIQAAAAKEENSGSDGASQTTSQSWMIPQWGTVYLLPLPPSTTHVSADTLKQPMFTFGAHLLSLLGTPTSGSLPLRLSTLARIRSADLLLRASSTLGSLARLSRSLPSISIPRSVADGVDRSMRHLEAACATLGGAEGLYHARRAEDEAERAFFEKSMVGQLYFPDEHKIAVYLPLLGPITVPLIIGAINEIRAFLKRRRQKADDAKEKKAT